MRIGKQVISSLTKHGFPAFGALTNSNTEPLSWRHTSGVHAAGVGQGREAPTSSRNPPAISPRPDLCDAIIACDRLVSIGAGIDMDGRAGRLPMSASRSLTSERRH